MVEPAAADLVEVPRGRVFLDHQAVLVVGVGEELLEVVAFTRHEDGVFADRVILVLFGDLFPEDVLRLFVFLFLHQLFALVVGGHRLGRIDEVDLFLLIRRLAPVERLQEAFHRTLHVVGVGHLLMAASLLACRAEASMPVLHPAQGRRSNNGRPRQRAGSPGGPSSAPTPNRKAIRHP